MAITPNAVQILTELNFPQRDDTWNNQSVEMLADRVDLWIDKYRETVFSFSKSGRNRIRDEMKRIIFDIQSYMLSIMSEIEAKTYLDTEVARRVSNSFKFEQDDSSKLQLQEGSCHTETIVKINSCIEKLRIFKNQIQSQNCFCVVL